MNFHFIASLFFSTEFTILIYFFIIYAFRLTSFCHIDNVRMEIASGKRCFCTENSSMKSSQIDVSDSLDWYTKEHLLVAKFGARHSYTLTCMQAQCIYDACMQQYFRVLYFSSIFCGINFLFPLRTLSHLNHPR